MVLCDQVYVMSLSLCVYGDWIIHGWWMIVLVKILCFDEFCWSWFLKIILFGILDEHDDVFPWI